MSKHPPRLQHHEHPICFSETAVVSKRFENNHRRGLTTFFLSDSVGLQAHGLNVPKSKATHHFFSKPFSFPTYCCIYENGNGKRMLFSFGGYSEFIFDFGAVWNMIWGHFQVLQWYYGNSLLRGLRISTTNGTS